MPTIFNKKVRILTILTALFGIALLINSCKKDSTAPVTLNQSFTQVNLVSSSASVTGARVDPNIINGWGMAFSPSGNVWISSNGKGTSVVYDKTGTQKLAPVTIPSPSAITGGAPTGQVFNATTDFKLLNANPAKFIFAGSDGVISGWNGGPAAVKMVDRSASAGYLGLTTGSNGVNNYLYATNFKGGKIEVFDNNFALVPMPFTDPGLPSGYSPYNIQNIGGLLYVMYAKINPTTYDEVKGVGYGYVNVFNTDGSFVKRFVSGGLLNAPYGIAQAPSTFLNSGVSAILIGNFGDGKIGAYDSNGKFLGFVEANGSVVQIEGLWGISFAPASATTIDPNWLFYAAGPSGEMQGLFGYITR